MSEHRLEVAKADRGMHDRGRVFREVFEQTVDAMFLTDDRERFVAANRAALAWFKVDGADLLSRHIRDAPEAGASQQLLMAWECLQRDGHYHGEWTSHDTSGVHSFQEVHATANVAPGRHLWTLRDVSVAHHAETAHRTLATLIESVDDAIIGEDLNGRIMTWNAAAERQYGLTVGEAIGQPIARFVPATHREEWDEVLARVASGSHVRNLETVRMHRSGREVHVSLTASPLRDEVGVVVGATTIGRDISETRTLRTRLTIADRMTSIGTLAAGVAHEINTPLAAVIANLALARQELDQLANSTSQRELKLLREELDDASDAASRVREIVRHLRTFSAVDNEDVKQSVDVRRSMESTLRMVRSEYLHRAKLIEHYGETPTVDANDGRLGQAFLNLLINAMQALDESSPERNEISITTTSDGAHVFVDIADNGPGIPADKLARIFEPFFTTKEIGVGTGMGLSICQGIVQGLGGEISVQTALGKGTCFRVALPIGVLQQRHASVAPSPLGPSAPESLATMGADLARKCILVIDDDPLMIRVAARTLSPQFEVTGVTDARDALGLVEAGQKYDAVLCDLMMPAMTGMDFFAELVRASPFLSTRVIFITGGAFTSKAVSFLARVTNPRLEKPFDPAALRRLVTGLTNLQHDVSRTAAP